jgi:hypothetical protein
MTWPGSPKNPSTAPGNKSSTWPGTPTSQQTPALNAPSTRFPYSLNENSSMADVADAMRTVFNGLTNHEQAFAAIPATVTTAATAAATSAVENIQSQSTSGVTSFNTATGSIIFFPGLGGVNNQIGNSAYTIQQSDNGAKIVAGDSSPVVVSLSSSVTAPWFAFIGNDSSATVALSTDSGATIAGIQSVYPGGTAIVFYDGATFWCEGVAIATDSSLGVVQPDGVTVMADSSGILSVPIAMDSSLGLVIPDGRTIGVDSGMLHTIGATGTIPLGPFLDSSMTSIFVQDGLITGWLHTP